MGSQIGWDQFDAIKFKAKVIGAKEMAGSPVRNHYIIHKTDSLDGVEFKGPRRALAGLLTLPRVTSGSAISPPHLSISKPSPLMRTTPSGRRSSAISFKENFSTINRVKNPLPECGTKDKSRIFFKKHGSRRFTTCDTSFANKELRNLRHG